MSWTFEATGSLPYRKQTIGLPIPKPAPIVPRMQIEAICRNESRTETVAAFAASILLHLLLILAIGFFLYEIGRAHV